MTEKPKPISIEAQTIQMPRLKRVKKLVNTEQLAGYFRGDFTNDQDERNHWMAVYALLAAFDADISREAFIELVVNALNMRSRMATCFSLQMAAANMHNAHLTPELLARSYEANKVGAHSDANEIAKKMDLLTECRGPDDQVH